MIVTEAEGAVLSPRSPVGHVYRTTPGIGLSNHVMTIPPALKAMGEELGRAGCPVGGV